MPHALRIEHSRPYMPPSYGVPESTEGLLPWGFSVVHLESGSDVVIIEGYFEEISRPARAFCQWLDEEFAQPYPDGGLSAIYP